MYSKGSGMFNFTVFIKGGVQFCFQFEELCSAEVIFSAVSFIEINLFLSRISVRYFIFVFWTHQYSISTSPSLI